MRVVEIYRSIQGESSYAGRPCVFVRTGGCALRCVYCDTPYALERGSGREMALDAVFAEALRLGGDLVELTGGEPLEQPETPELCRRLLDAGAEVLVETGGHMPVDALPGGAVKILDVKTPGSRMTRKIRWENLRALTPRDEIKFVVVDRNDFEWALGVCREHGLLGRNLVHISPAFGLVPPDRLAEWIAGCGEPVRLQLQLHKYIWAPEARGV